MTSLRRHRLLHGPGVVAVLAVTVAGVVAGCLPDGTSMAKVQPTLDAASGAGFPCGRGTKDNVPSGLTQWICTGSVDGYEATLLIGGNEDGVTDVQLVLADGREPTIARLGFLRMAADVPPLSRIPGLAEALDGWQGEPRQPRLGEVTLSAACDMQCIIGLSGPDPRAPMPIP